MLRRNFFQWISTSIIPLLIPNFLRGQATGLSDSEHALLLQIAAVVLPSSLGATRIHVIGEEFVQWTKNYRAGADAGYGYGFPRLRVLPPNPADRYPDQFRELEQAAATHGRSFASLDAEAKRQLIVTALEKANVNKIPPEPNGRHVAADLLAFFYNSADGQDFLYQAAIKRDDCRGLSTSLERPAHLA